MPRILRLVFLFASVIFLFLLLGCKKEDNSTNIFTGKVTDKKTGVPVANANVLAYTSSSSPPHQLLKDYSTKTNAQGYYTMTIPGEDQFTFSEVIKSGYLPKIYPAKSSYLVRGDSHIVDVQLIPIDGHLRLIVNNVTGQYDSIYVTIYNKTVFDEGFGLDGPGWPVVLLKGNSFRKIFDFPADEVVSMYWDFKKFTTPNSLFNNSILLSPIDTTDFIIDY